VLYIPVSLELDDVVVVELAEVLDVRLLEVPNFLDSHDVVPEFPLENCALGPGPQPLQIPNLLKRNLPFLG
jgi:hypothetical protein